MNEVTELVIVKDNGRQGLAIFVPCDIANYGKICVFDLAFTVSEGRQADMTGTCGYEEASMDYFHKMKKPKANDPRVEPFMERYRQYAEAAYTNQPCKLTLRRVFKDQQAYKAERWKR